MSETCPNPAEQPDDYSIEHAIPTEDEGCLSRATVNKDVCVHAEDKRLEEKRHQTGVNVRFRAPQDNSIEHAIPTEDEGCLSIETANKNVCVDVNGKGEMEEKRHQTGVHVRFRVKRRSGSRSKHRAGRNRKRRWKPYSKLTWDERMALDERDTRRAHKIREQMSASGIVLAPYNTTQFLMNDHDIQEPDYDYTHDGHKHRDSKHQGDSSDEYYSYSDDDDYINQQFKEDYDNFHDQYLNSLSQEQLVWQWVELEDQIEALEKKLSAIRQERLRLGSAAIDPEVEMEKIKVFRDEIKKITIENARLEMLNKTLNNSVEEINFVR